LNERFAYFDSDGNFAENLALRRRRGQGFPMGEKAEPCTCVICFARGKAKREAPNRISRVTIQARSVVLCREHAGVVAIKMPKTWDDLRAIFALPPERRSPIPRRVEADDRRVFPPRPEGRRTSFGRRKADPLD
jgi:hypothetical protein